MRLLPLVLMPSLILGAAPTASRAKTPAKKREVGGTTSAPNPAFPFPIHQKTLPNGLRVAVIPTGMPGLVSLYIPVSTGSRNEVEAGKSGFAHFFEHMMFRGTKAVSPEQWQETLKRTGAAQNAYTSDDLTCYHTTCDAEDLETWVKLEADRFQHLEYPENQFKDESRAVLGEYNKNSSDPYSKLREVLRDAAFTTHTYKHTTMGFLKDIEDMPNQFQYSREFFHRWYRPDNVTVILVGDITPAKGFGLIEHYFGGWKGASVQAPVVPAEPEHTQPVSVHVPWATPTLPWVVVAFHTPAHYSSTGVDAKALGLAGKLLFGEQSEAYQRLVVQDQIVDQLFASGGASRDPELFLIAARVKKFDDLAKVREVLLDTCAKALAVPFSPARLEEAKTEARLGFAHTLASADRIASVVSRLACYERDPEAVLKQLSLEDQVTTEDLARLAKATFTDGHRVLLTLSHEPLPEALKSEITGVEARASRLAELPRIAVLEQASPSPLVDLRLVFRAGSVADPAGKEGLASLTAAMVADAGTRSKSLIELTKASAATGSGLGSEVDKEFTSFMLSAPRLKATEALDLALEQLVETGFRMEDFTRLKAQQSNALQVGLKANNDEELGKLALEARLFPEPFGHPVLGTQRGLEAITLEDVKAFARARYTRENLRVGLGGGFTPEHKAQVVRRLAELPEHGAASPVLPPPAPITVTRVQILAKETRATAISFGFPIAVDRRHEDFAALWVASSYLGQHRNSTSHLYQRLREVRGLNYGDYAYIEAFPRGMFKFQPDPGVLRSLNHFQVWIRPVAPRNAAFALKGAVYELGKLIQQGLSDQDFEASRTFLVKFLAQLTDTGSRRLGHDLDMAELGLDGGYVALLKSRLQSLTRAQVNAAITRHLRATNLEVVMVSGDPETLKQDLTASICPLPAYQSPKPNLKTEDEAISRLALDLKPEDITITPLEAEFR